ncbi:DNA polymerase III subunit chi [Aquitalea sp. S1-19]|nr:DNA polymerase III subunit chi [Aquitalea sp. S1-19]MCP9761107.1 DNA polymerase III subunit chi [Aquitalea sp. S1-19]
MTQIDFYTGVADAPAFACKLTATAYRKGAKLFVLLPDAAALERFSARLWSLSETAFIPHCKADDAIASQTPVWLGLSLAACSEDRVLLNLGGEPPADPAAFSRILEIIGVDEDALAMARTRFRFYRSLGLAIEHHDMRHRQT